MGVGGGGRGHVILLQKTELIPLVVTGCFVNSIGFKFSSHKLECCLLE